MMSKYHKLILITLFILSGIFSASFASAATQIFRSVAPGATAALATDNSHAWTVAISSGVITFSSSPADNVGVGDAIIIDTGGTANVIDASDTVVFIHGRTNTWTFTVRTHTGTVPTDIASNDTYSIYRAYTSLFNAEAGTKNTSIPVAFNGGNRNIVTSNEEWNIACYANGTTADSTQVSIAGWTTGATNFIRIFTPTTMSQVGRNQRNNGVWDTNKYYMETPSAGTLASISAISVNYFRVEGLQIRNTTSSNNQAINLGTTSTSAFYVSGNIFRGNNHATWGIIGILGSTAHSIYIYNNIFYDNIGTSSPAIFWNHSSLSIYIYNNTIYNCTRGFERVADTTHYIKNNIISSPNAFQGTFVDNDARNNYNVISENTNDVAIGTNGKYNQTFNFLSTTSGSQNFHLTETDTVAKDAGVDLSADTYLPFNDDIDGSSRVGSVHAWDVGADEVSTQIYRSVGPSATDALATDNSHNNTVAVSSSVATFSAALPDNIGVGDAVIIDTGGTANAIDASDTIVFIHGRTSSTVYTVKTQTGVAPSNITSNDTYSIYRAYTNLNHVDQGTKNTSIPMSFNGGNRDLAANNEIWNVACYANGTTGDVLSEDWYYGDDWVTGVYNYMKIYTPNTLAEVGVSQRHSGKLDKSKYYLNYTTGSSIIIWEDLRYLRIEGLQIVRNGTGSTTTPGLNVSGDVAGAEMYISENIITSETGVEFGYGLQMYGSGNFYVYNNIIYNIAYVGILFGDTEAILYAYNNTIYDIYEYWGIANYGERPGTVVAINNIINNTGGNCYDGNFSALSTNNISDEGSAPANGSYYRNTTVSFVNVTPGSEDFHLTQTDTTARQLGANLTTNANLKLTRDIDGQLRAASGAGWDIGADEGTVEFVATVAQSGGDYSTLSSWEAGNQTDLTANATRVFSHGGKTGTIADNASVTGLTSSATATVVHATTTQILLENISGTFQSGEVVQVSAGNNVTLSNNGNPPSAVAKIDNAWSSADSTATVIDGWVTKLDNYIKIYTASAARHRGLWEANKYRISISAADTAAIDISEPNVTVSGVQIETTGANNNVRAIRLNTDAIIPGASNNLTGNIIKSSNSSSTGNQGISVSDYTDSTKLNIFNNVIYGFNNESVYIYTNNYSDVKIQNNTIYDSAVGIAGNSSNVIAANNIVQNSTTGYSGTFATQSAANISNDGSAPGSAGIKNNAQVQFVSTASGAEDFHLHVDDRFAKEAGVDLSAYFTVDLDNIGRVTPWDIGADETVTQIYRSVGPAATSALATDNAHANTITLSAGTATFSAALPDNIGVGDAVIVDTGGTANTIDGSDTILFIHKRNSATSYVLRTQTGAIPSDISSNDTYSIYRAYTSLLSAENGTKNASIPMTFNGGDRDLVTNNEFWNVACYSNGTTGDTLSSSWYFGDGWVVSKNNYMKIYTPNTLSEVGVTQRHNGKLDKNKYYINHTTSTNLEGWVIWDDLNYLKIEGLQIVKNGTSVNSRGITMDTNMINAGIYISENIITSETGVDFGYGVELTGSGIFYVFNNILYNFIDDGIFLADDAATLYAYNNTIYDVTTYWGIANYSASGTIVAINNIVEGTGDFCYYGTFSGSSSNNISDDGTAPGSNSKTNTTALFIDKANGNLCLKAEDTVARDAGLNLSTNAALSFSNDIRGKARPKSTGAWNVGACEDFLSEKSKLEGTQIKMQGSVKIE